MDWEKATPLKQLKYVRWLEAERKRLMKIAGDRSTEARKAKNVYENQLSQLPKKASIKAAQLLMGSEYYRNKFLEVRFTDDPKRYYWGLFCHGAVRAILKKYKMRFGQLEMICMFKYCQSVTKREIAEWGITIRQATVCVEKGYVSRSKIRQRILFFPTELGKQIIQEYCNLVDETIKIQFKLQQLLDEETKFRKPV